MSMSLLVAEFKFTQEKLDSNYLDLSKKINVNEFINDYIDVNFISTFNVYDDESEFTYKEINVDYLLEKINFTSSNELYLCKNIDNMARIESIQKTAKDLVMLNQLYYLCATYLAAKPKSKNIIKLIIA